MKNLVLVLIVAGMLLGVAVGAAIHEWAPGAAKETAGYLAMINTSIFLPLIKMIIAPLVFSTLTVGIAHIGGGAALGRIGARTLSWFIIAALVSLALGLVIVNVLQPGVGFPVDHRSGAPAATAAFTLKDFLSHVIPTSIVAAMASNEVLQIVVFACFLGIALSALGARTQGVVDLLEQVGQVMLKVTGYVMALAPLAVFAAMSSAVALNGLEVILDYGRLVGSFYLALFVLWALLVAAGFVVLGPRIFSLLGHIRAPGLLAFSTASSEAAYPRLLEQLEKFGVANRAASFVLPLGYSFNLDGSMMYCTFAAMFIAQATGVHLSIEQQIQLMLLLFVTSKGIAGVPRASLVVIQAALPMVGLDPNLITLVLAVDVFMDMGRTATNVIGNSIACAVVAKWEGLLRAPGESVLVDEPVEPVRAAG